MTVAWGLRAFDFLSLNFSVFLLSCNPSHRSTLDTSWGSCRNSRFQVRSINIIDKFCVSFPLDRDCNRVVFVSPQRFHLLDGRRRPTDRARRFCSTYTPFSGISRQNDPNPSFVSQGSCTSSVTASASFSPIRCVLRPAFAVVKDLVRNRASSSGYNASVHMPTCLSSFACDGYQQDNWSLRALIASTRVRAKHVVSTGQDPRQRVKRWNG